MLIPKCKNRFWIVPFMERLPHAIQGTQNGWWGCRIRLKRSIL